MRNRIYLDPDLETLERDGFVIIEAVLDGASLASIDRAIARMHQSARQDPLWQTGGTLHLDGLLEIGEPFARAWTEKRVVRAVAAMLGDEYAVRRAHVRSPLQGEGAQALHRDYPARPEHGHAVATAIVAIDSFTEANGATRVVRGSHTNERIAVPKDHDTPFVGERLITMRAGSALVFSGHLFHSGTRNRSGARRHAMQITFARPDAVMFS